MKTLALFTTGLLCLTNAPAYAVEPTTFAVGVAAVDITPDDPIRLNGFGGRTRESEGVRQPIWARALAIGTGDSAVVIITVDTLGIPDELTERIAASLRAHGLDRSALAICASHTHSGPMIRGCANTLFGRPIPDDQWQTILRYTDELQQKLERVAIDALNNRQPSHLAWGIGKVGFAFNRRTPGGPVDHDLPMLTIRDPDGRLRAVFTNYACHCVTLSDDLISGDWAGYAMEHIQRQNPGCTALISIGCGADSNPRGGVLGSRADVADSLGAELAAEVQRLLAMELRPLTAPPTSAIKRVVLPLAPSPSKEKWEELAKNQNAIGYHARVQLDRLNRGDSLMTEISYPIQSICFGDELAMTFLPGEVVVDYALRLKRELDGGRLWINAYANACPGYVPSERILREGGYEGGGAMVYYDIPGPYAAGLEQVIVTTVEQQLKPQFDSVVDTSKTNGVRPLSSAEAVSSLQVQRGFRAELVVSEPLIESPVAIAFGPDGRLWVAEMSDYPQGKPTAKSGDGPAAEEADDDSKNGGQIRCVYDDDHDGRFERSEVFLQGIPFPTGVTVWRKGVLVCAAPDVLYAEDTDGDGRADKIRKLLTGFATHNYQARVNSLEYGLDGWVYGSCGLFGGQITSVVTGQTVPLGQRDFRFNPDTGDLEPASGATQQGRVRNDSGDWFGCNNSTLLMHYPLADHYLRRNPGLKPSPTVVGIAAGPEPGRLFSISQQVLFMLSGPPNRPTAACGLGIYRDDLLGAEYSENAFTCEPVNNLVHRQILIPQGVSFTSRRDDDERDREFLASTDPWFRPVQARTGLDGALWVVDMYRYVIEHPIWIPPDTLATLDTRAGSSMGRIYRIAPAETPGRKIPNLSELSGAQLAAAMESPNGMQRDLIQQLIQWADDQASIPALKQLCLESGRPEVRVQAISTWANLETPAADTLLQLLRDPDPRVRRHAVRISESQLNDNSALASAVFRLAGDVDAKVQLQVAWTAGNVRSAEASQALATLFVKSGDDGYLRTAVESSFSSHNIASVLQEVRLLPDSQDAVSRLTASAAMMADEDTFHSLLEQIADRVTSGPSAKTLQQLAAFLDAWSRRSPPNIDPQRGDMLTLWKQALDSAAATMVREESPTAARIAAAQVLAFGPFLGDPCAEILGSLLTPRTPPELQTAVIEAMQNDNRTHVAEMLLADWGAREPRQRKQIVALLLSRPPWTTPLLAAIQAGTVSSGELDLSQQQSLRDNPDETIRLAASHCLQPRSSVTRRQLIDQYLSRMNDAGDPVMGKQVFQKHCVGCHRLQDLGHAVGPDVAGYSGKPVESLVTALLDPNQATDPRYQAYVVVLKNGRSLTGLIAEETSSSLTLLTAEGKRETALRSDVEELRSTGKSLMPEGFEQNASPVDVNHLWAWLRTLRTAPKSLPGNHPQLISVSEKGNVVLPASQAEICGGDITFELSFQNVGYWHHQDDTVRWRLTSASIREFDVWAEWACDPGAAGNQFTIDGPQPSLTATVRSTGAWSVYQLVRLGRARVRAGDSELVMRPGDGLRAALVDLRAIHLVVPGGVPLATGMVRNTDALATTPQNAASIAEFLLNDNNSAGDREKVLAAALDKAAEVIARMAADLPQEAGSKEEYRRIPWIWRIAMAVGKQGDDQQIREVLRVSLPSETTRLEHWQAVVIGGGIINGLSLSNKWPREELNSIIGDDKALKAAWTRSLDLSLSMANEESVPSGTRYDALRLVAMLDDSVGRPVLERFLQQGVNAELQMGAVSGLSDMQFSKIVPPLIRAFSHLTEQNRMLAIAAMVRSEDRCLTLLQALQQGQLPHDVSRLEMVRELQNHPSEKVRSLAAKVLVE